MAEANNRSLARSGVKSVVLSILILNVNMLLFFVSAGRIEIFRAWVFFGITAVYVIVSNLVVYSFDPELIAQRLKRTREGSKKWDEVLMRTINLTAICVIPVVAGLDVGRYHWSDLSIYYMAIGLLFYVASSVLINWAMITNPYFESTVRIQRDRGHKVVMSGPYRFIRHPGYLAGILWALSVPLIIGSLFAFIPVTMYVALTVIRTLLEDRTLQNELSDYSEYIRKVKCRLFPGIW